MDKKACLILLGHLLGIRAGRCSMARTPTMHYSPSVSTSSILLMKSRDLKVFFSQDCIQSMDLLNSAPPAIASSVCI